MKGKKKTVCASFFKWCASTPSLTSMTVPSSGRKKCSPWKITARVTLVKWKLENMTSIISAWMEILPVSVRKTTGDGKECSVMYNRGTVLNAIRFNFE